MANSQSSLATSKELMANGRFVQYGCGLSAPEGWINFDASPTLRLKKIPLAGNVVTRGRAAFPKSVRYGDIVKGLPIKTGSCDGVYASHVLEHLALEDFKRALMETRRILRDGGRFRLIVPDLYQLAREYLKAVDEGDIEASHKFMRDSYLGMVRRPKSIKEKIMFGLGNSEHLWMWDRLSMEAALSNAGFRSIRRAGFGDSEEPAFALVEDAARFESSVAYEAIK